VVILITSDAAAHGSAIVFMGRSERNRNCSDSGLIPSQGDFLGIVWVAGGGPIVLW
jgi:hypothetical protein